ncbi:MAG: NUDIX hydrolase [Planctomycetes bacterium]|nr:NUDIX hydrolase [Planctomycetota bacterium]
MSRLREIRIVDDQTARSRCDEGFLTLRRLVLRNVYLDGSESDDYPCDLVSRRGVDAVVAVLYELADDGRGRRALRVLLREGIRAPIYLRRDKTFVQPDPREYRGLLELVAGMLEPDDGPGAQGLARRARAETDEEAGLDLPEARFAVLGGETFASPGTGDEKLYYTAAEAPVHEADLDAADGDGSVMEEGATLRVLELADAIAACRDGRIPDMKTEIGLLRLCEHVGYVPQLDLFVDELPADLAARYRRLGVAARDGRAVP